MNNVPAIKLLPRSGSVPRIWRREVAQILIPKDALARRVRALARQIQRDYQDRDLVMVAVMSGTLVFLADLIRHVTLPLRLDFIGVSSYKTRTRPGPLVFTKELGLDVRGRDVLIVDDILDTGQTLARVLQRLQRLGPRSLRTCVLLEKKARRVESVQADYVGFEIPDVFVVGYGLDYAERYRHLPFVGVLREALLRSGAAAASPRPVQPRKTG